MPFSQGGCTFSSQGHFSSSTWPLGSPGKCCFLGHSQMFPQGDLLPHVVSMTTHGLTNLRTESPVPSSFLSICLSLMSQWLLGYNRKGFLFLFWLFYLKSTRQTSFLFIFIFPFQPPITPPWRTQKATPMQILRSPTLGKFTLPSFLRSPVFSLSPPKVRPCHFQSWIIVISPFVPLLQTMQHAFPDPHVLSCVLTNWNQHPYWAFMVSYKLSTILIITLSSSTREIMCLTCDSRFTDPLKPCSFIILLACSWHPIHPTPLPI